MKRSLFILALSSLAVVAIFIIAALIQSGNISALWRDSNFSSSLNTFKIGARVLVEKGGEEFLTQKRRNGRGYDEKVSPGGGRSDNSGRGGENIDFAGGRGGRNIDSTGTRGGRNMDSAGEARGRDEGVRVGGRSSRRDRGASRSEEGGRGGGGPRTALPRTQQKMGGRGNNDREKLAGRTSGTSIRTGRGQGNTGKDRLVLTPRNFSLEGLTNPTTLLKYPGISPSTPIETAKDAGDALCRCAFQRDVVNLKYLLYDVGVPPTAMNSVASDKNALHCLATSYTNTEKTTLLKNTAHRETWFHDMFERNFLKNGATKVYSVLMREMFDNERTAIAQSAQWLIRAGTPVDAKDSDGNTPLILASIGDQPDFVKLLIESGADVNAVNSLKRSALHYATALGHHQVAEV
jgi:hypothetical protein